MWVDYENTQRTQHAVKLVKVSDLRVFKMLKLDSMQKKKDVWLPGMNRAQVLHLTENSILRLWWLPRNDSLQPSTNQTTFVQVKVAGILDNFKAGGCTKWQWQPTSS